jgi:hypothetical protein
VTAVQLGQLDYCDGERFMRDAIDDDLESDDLEADFSIDSAIR